MTSIHTNIAAVAALSTLRGVTAGLSAEQDRVSSGLRVQKAADNAAYWSISTTMKSESKAKSAAADGIALGSAILDTTYSALDTVRKSFVEIRNLVIQARDLPAPKFEPTPLPFFPDAEYAKSDQAKLDQSISEFLGEARDAITSANFSGVNLLYHSANDTTLPSTVTYSLTTGYSDGKVQSVDLDAMDWLLINDRFGDGMDPLNPQAFNPEQAKFDSSETVNVPGTLNSVAITYFNGAVATVPITTVKEGGDEVLRELERGVNVYGGDRNAIYDDYIQKMDDKLNYLTDQMATLGAMQKSFASYEEQNQSNMDTISKGVGKLVDADMDASSARIRALQAQQQLGIQSLSIANAEADNVLRLFQ
jgi:flagellin